MTRRDPRPTAGFSFIELIVVMGAMAVLMALTAGFLTSTGKQAEIAQARALIEETAYRCINASMGSQRAFFILRRGHQIGGEDEVYIEAGVAGTVLTHQFETLTFASGSRVPDVSGEVKLEKNKGHTGNGARFMNGALVFAAEAQFAMTEGLEWEAWLMPDAGPQNMVVLQGMGDEEASYEISLIRLGNAPAYDVKVRLLLRDAIFREGSAALPKEFETVGAPVAADGMTWTHVAVMFDGMYARIFVTGVEMPLRAEEGPTSRNDSLGQKRMRIKVPDTGVVRLSIGGESRGFRGMMDSVIVRGVFRSSENEHRLPGRLEVIHPALPVRIEYANGRLAGTGTQQTEIWMRDLAYPDDLPLRIVLGRAGTVSSKWTDESPPVPAEILGGAR